MIVIRERITKATKFTSKRCQGWLDKNLDKRITLDRNDAETVDRFSYLKDVFSTEERVQEAITSRKKSAWKMTKDFYSILCK